MKSQAEISLGRIFTGQYTPDSGSVGATFDDGSKLAKDVHGIGWHLTHGPGGIPVAQPVHTPHALRKTVRV
jgi:hypothetical protein